MLSQTLSLPPTIATWFSYSCSILKSRSLLTLCLVHIKARIDYRIVHGTPSHTFPWAKVAPRTSSELTHTSGATDKHSAIVRPLVIPVLTPRAIELRVLGYDLLVDIMQELCVEP